MAEDQRIRTMEELQQFLQRLSGAKPVEEDGAVPEKNLIHERASYSVEYDLGDSQRVTVEYDEDTKPVMIYESRPPYYAWTYDFIWETK